MVTSAKTTVASNTFEYYITPGNKGYTFNKGENTNKNITLQDAISILADGIIDEKEQKKYDIDSITASRLSEEFLSNKPIILGDSIFKNVKVSEGKRFIKHRSLSQFLDSLPTKTKNYLLMHINNDICTYNQIIESWPVNKPISGLINIAAEFLNMIDPFAPNTQAPEKPLF